MTSFTQGCRNIYTYKKGVSLLLRDSLQIATPTDAPGADETNAPSGSIERHVCITDHKATVRERVGDMLFEYPGGSFFQNNNSVLVPLINHVRDAIFATSDLPEATSGINAENNRPTHLVDAYCGSGLFSITLSPFFETIAGIELSIDSIKSAKANAGLNGIPESKCTFYAGDASNIFSAVSQFPPDKTVLIIDPPRKGCDENFLEQLVRFRCARVVYVSCNVHTQARDIGTILKRTESEDGGRGKYALESLRGVDLFPQTAHVESVAVLKLI
jgi:tRNA (uracil-5-)-methyltransferase